MKSTNFRIPILLVSMLVFIVACGAPAAATEEVVPTEAPTEVVVDVQPTATTAPPAIQHQDIPISLPDKQNGLAGDFDSSKILENKTPIGGDRFTYGRFERPFNANTMDVYFSQIDIINTSVFQDDTWVYGTIELKELQADSTENVKYAVELDVNIDGKGDWLVIAGKPTSTDWSVTGVQVYKDANQDVGGELAMLTDEVKTENDGFESLVFDQGLTGDPDTAWVRISPSNPNVVEFAVKKGALENPTRFLINMWAGTSLLSPDMYDINDQFTHEEAGAADEGLEYFYPIKAVSEIDNTCRMAVGFQPNGSEPGICPVPQQQQFGDPVPPGASCPAGTFQFCTNNSCFCAPILIITIPTDPPPVP